MCCSSNTIFWLGLPFYSDEKQTCRQERLTKKEREREKAKGVSGQSSGLVIRVTLGMVPPSAGVWFFLLPWWPPTPPGTDTHTHTQSVLSAIVTLNSFFTVRHWEYE